jgi:outer membrane protein assembly factor BamE (lipoprotein component of BamABCDE complex)
MVRMKQIGLVLAAAALLGGCSSIRSHRGYIVDETLVRSVQPGIDNQTSVERMLGRPTFTSQFGEPVWYYVSSMTGQKPFSTPTIRDHMILAVRFDAAGNVTGADRNGIEQVAQISPSSAQTPTLGRERSFLEDLFGNIGTVGAPGTGGGAAGPGG